jgi:hypothetical protein
MNDDEERADFPEQYFDWNRSEREEEPEVPLSEPIDDGALEYYYLQQGVLRATLTHGCGVVFAIFARSDCCAHDCNVLG